MSSTKNKALKGYKRPGYSWTKSIATRKKTGFFKVVQSGEGHRAGFEWGDRKDIDPESRVRKYSKNSPSFDEGVWESKQARKKALDKVRENTIKQPKL